MNMCFRFTALIVLASASVSAHAEEKDGLSLTVAKVTLKKEDAKAWTQDRGSYETTTRTQAIKVTAKNTSFKPMAEGELEWNILVVGTYFSQLQSGIEKIKALKPANIQELQFGSAEAHGWRKGTSKKEDRVEWKLVVKQGEKEIMKSQSCPDFDTLAKHAIKEGEIPPFWPDGKKRDK